MEQVELRAALCGLLGPDCLAAGMQVVVYGSRRRTRDIDIVVVQPRETATPSLKVGQLDLFVVSRKRFDRLLGVLDLLAVEPVLTGELVCGDAPAWSAVRDRLVATPPSRRCVEHAGRRSLEEYLVACRLWEQYEQDGASIPAINGSASRDNDGKMHISLCNVNPIKALTFLTLIIF